MVLKCENWNTDFSLYVLTEKGSLFSFLGLKPLVYVLDAAVNTLTQGWETFLVPKVIKQKHQL